ncbi:MAG TPA: DUF6370 family protein [Polyangia bacterium]|jgi:hypothetical protein
MKTSLVGSLMLGALLSLSAAHAADRAGVAEGKPPIVKAKGAPAVEAKPAAQVTLKGQLTCAKCGLHESSTCQNVLRVQEAGASETRYYLSKNDVAQAHHEEVCGGQIAATVTGSVHDEDGKKILTASAITLN